jgi:hypothetical protein
MTDWRTKNDQDLTALDVQAMRATAAEVVSSAGKVAVILRRLDGLEQAIRERDWERVQWHYDNVRRAALKARRGQR